jgi:hypothetical protein
MSTNSKSCHGTYDCLEASSTRQCMAPLFRIYQAIRSYAVWHLENMGLCGTLRYTLSKVVKPWTKHEGNVETLSDKKKPTSNQEVLNLRPGELVEVRSAEEILATLDKSRRCNGLLWMAGMRKLCGRSYKVFKRVETIMLESSGELRKVKNTVLLEGVMCDGSQFCGCDRSCFHFWREAWLKRAVE